MPNLLIVDDEPDILEVTKMAFETMGYEVATAASGEEALQTFQSDPPHVLLVDYKLHGMSGTDFLRKARAIRPTIPAVMITGLTHQVEEVEADCNELGVTLLHKPLQMEEVFRTVKKVLENSSP